LDRATTRIQTPDYPNGNSECIRITSHVTQYPNVNITGFSLRGGFGLKIVDSSYNDITKNDISNNKYNGLVCCGSYNKIFDNIVSNNWNGQSPGRGIYLLEYQLSHDNIIYHNTVEGNFFGINIGADNYRNTVYQNNIIKSSAPNSRTAVDSGYYNGIYNQWYNGPYDPNTHSGGGNYYSDRTPGSGRYSIYGSANRYDEYPFDYQNGWV
jgi:parallel beta-helix repeat protein